MALEDTNPARTAFYAALNGRSSRLEDEAERPVTAPIVEQQAKPQPLNIASRGRHPVEQG
jgi:hypothetical protein